MSESALRDRSPAPMRRTKRSVVGFVADAASEAVLRDALRDLVQAELAHNGVDVSFEIKRGPLKSAIAAMMRAPAPDVLIVDIGADPAPGRLLAALSEVIEPSVALFVLGEVDDIALYRLITRDIGAADYMFKPLTRETVARYLSPLISNDNQAAESTRGGRLIALTGARGGVGTSTIAAMLALYLGETSNRHTLLLDADPFIGISHGLCGGAGSEALGALLSGERMSDADTLDAAITPVRGRLSLLALPPALDRRFVSKDGTAKALIAALRQRFNFIVVDLPFLPLQSHRELLEVVHHRVIVLDPSIAGLRDTLRLLALPKGPLQPQRPTIMLNHANIKGGFARKRLEDALKRKVDIAMADLPKRFQSVTKLADLVVSPRDPAFRAIADLAHEVGFDGGRAVPRIDPIATQAA
jgi:pilus assembly protein CpaE